MEDTIIGIIKNCIKDLENIKSKFLSKELDDIIDEGLYIRTLEKHNMLLGILNKYHEEINLKKRVYNQLAHSIKHDRV